VAEVDVNLSLFPFTLSFLSPLFTYNGMKMREDDIHRKKEEEKKKKRTVLYI